MADNNPQQPLNPQSLRLEDISKILTASGVKPVTVEMLQADVLAGAPLNKNGTMNLVHYAAWVARETADGN